MNAYERRQEICKVLISSRFETIPNLAHRFEVSERTILRDIVMISGSASLVPIYTIQGNGGGVRVADWYYRHPSRYLSDTEIELLKSLIPHLQEPDRIVMRSILDTFSMP